MICPNCGHQNPGGAKFCMDCGNALPAQPVVQPQSAPARIPQPPVFQELQQQAYQQTYPQTEFQQPVYQQVPPPQGGAAKKKTIIIVVAVVVAMLLLCCILTAVFAVVPTVRNMVSMTGITTTEDVADLLSGEDESTGSDSSSTSTPDDGSSALTESAVSMEDVAGDYDVWFVFATSDGADPNIACAMTIEATSDTQGTLTLTPYEAMEYGEYVDISGYGTISIPCSIDGSTLAFDVDFFDIGMSVPFDFDLEEDGANGWIGYSFNDDARDAGFLEVYGYMYSYEE
ncbi:MAG: zinc ribbon domain-containing protein [Actinobacteria bacterium]|nr:zinc ribbon domain-containing protein [Actinomycetota bacterium]